MYSLPVLKPGDSIEIIAPASRCTAQQLNALKTLFESWQLECIVDEHLFGPDLLCANSDEVRFRLLKKALERTDTKAVICARGGYGSMRLIPALQQLKPPAPAKLFVGMSDITALHLYLQQQWHWPTVHGAASADKFSQESIMALKALLFGDTPHTLFSAVPMNAAAQKSGVLESSVIGGNLCLIQASIGTSWQMNANKKIIFLEEINERGYQIDRMLEHLHQAGVFKGAEAIVLGDFIQGEEPNGSSLINPVLERFAKQLEIPVVRVEGVGHGYINFPLLLGTCAQLQLGQHCSLVAFRLY